MGSLQICELESDQIPIVTDWSRREGFAPGLGDIEIYRHTDRQGLWIAWLDQEPIGCIAGVRYNLDYGFIGLYLVVPHQRGHGYGQQLWKHALDHLADLTCIGLEAAPARILDYAGWGFESSSSTTRWCCFNKGISEDSRKDLPSGLHVVEGRDIPSEAVQLYDAQREPSPRPHFLADWLGHQSGQVLALLDDRGNCHGFGRIRPCLLQDGEGWRIGPLLADSPGLATYLIRMLQQRHPGVLLIDTPGINTAANELMATLGFTAESETMRMYRGDMPKVALNDVFALACLELG
jgi:ribosomal-protein-alanine N-acetyltransferase